MSQMGHHILFFYFWYMNPTDVVTTAQSTTINSFLTKIFQAVIDFLFTIVNILVNFFTQPAVLGALATILVIY